MRPFPVAATSLLAALAMPARADACGGLVETIAAEAGAVVESRSDDFARFTAGPAKTLALACGGASHPSSIGVHTWSESLPDDYFDLVGRVGHLVTGAAADALKDAARRARDRAGRRSHGSVAVPGARVTCALTKSGRGTPTLCAVIGEADRT